MAAMRSRCDRLAMITIPPQIREEMKEPFGILILDQDVSHDTLATHLEGMKVVVVGDATALRVFGEGFPPDMAIVDMKTKRNNRMELDERFLDSFDHRLAVINPDGVLTDELVDIVKKGLDLISNNEKVLIVVDGEEDLAFVPCLLDAPDNSVVLYGQPDQGIVVSHPTLERKTFIKNALKTMEA